MISPKWEGKLVLPPLPDRKEIIGGNLIIQRVFPGAECQAQIFDSEFPGHDLVRTRFAPPFSEFLLRHKGARRRSTPLGVLTGDLPKDTTTWPEELRPNWDSLGALEGYCDTPTKVLDSWSNSFSFRIEDEDSGEPGLRKPQMGALHAICAHFAVGSEFEAATVVLPTGTGKTETMLATQVYLRFDKTLVLVPTDTLRSQIANKFATLGVLPDAHVVPAEIPRPRVAIIKHGLKSIEDACAILDRANIIVALPDSLHASNPEALHHLAHACSALIVDEAHHVTATTWNSIRERFHSKCILQFTATPYRRDGKRIEGKIIFNYKLGDAQAAGYYRPITLRTVEEYGDDDARDRAIAEEAIAALRRDRDQLGRDHLLMARTRTKDRAESVGAIYSDLAPDLHPVVIYSGPGHKRRNDEALARLLDRGPQGSRIVICVDMLGEGFDLPNLKIAALHDVHKSLAITLQFIGRFTRKGNWQKIGEATVVANIADPMAESKLAGLYSEGADWDHLIRRLNDERIASELHLQEVVIGLKKSGDLSAQLSLWNLRPALSTQFFRTNCKAWSPFEYRSALPQGAESWYAFNEAENVLVAVVCRAAEVRWGNYQNVRDTIYDLVILRWDTDNDVLCVYASNYDALRSEKMAIAVTDESTALVKGEPIFRILNNVELPLVKSLGSSRLGAISFTSYFGPNVTEGLADIEKAEAELNNIACLGYENGERVLWGGTKRRGKIWQASYGTILEWINWTASTWAKVASNDTSDSNVVNGFLRPQKLDKPYSSYPISIQWGEQAQMRRTDRQGITFGTEEQPLLMADLEIAEVSNDGAIVVRIVSDIASSEYRQTISDALPLGYKHEHVSGPLVRFRKGRDEAIPLEEYLQKDPFIIRYADGSYSYNCYHIATKINAGTFDRDRLEAWTWDDIPLNKESMNKRRETLTIQYRTFEKLSPEYDLVFNDDGRGEVADLICLKDLDENSIRLTLVHCKGAHGNQVSQDIRNFYTLCGQAQKNITARHKGLPSLYLDLKRRQDRWAHEGASRFLKGGMKELVYFKEKARRSSLSFDVVLVQPGASLRTITEESLRLLATTELYLMKTTQASLRVVLSP